MTNQAEYMQFALAKDDVDNLPAFCNLLYDYLLAHTDGRFMNRVRSMEFFCSEDGSFLFLNVVIGARPLLSFQITRTLRKFFMQTVSNIWRFMRFFTLEPRIVFFSDSISLNDANQIVEYWTLTDLDSVRVTGCKAVVLRSSSFFFCEFEAEDLTGNGDSRAFFSNSIVFCSSEEEIPGLIGKRLSQDGAKLMGMVQIVETVPVLSVPNFDCSSFTWSSPNILHVSGRVYY